MKKQTQIAPEQKKDLKAFSRTRTEANKRRHRSGATAQPGRMTRYRPCAAQAPPSRRTKISSRKGTRRHAEKQHLCVLCALCVRYFVLPLCVRGVPA